MDVIDLREQPKGCREHPLIKLKNKVRKLGRGDYVKVITDISVIPLQTIKVIAEKNGLVMEVVREEDGVYELILKKG